MKCFLFWFNLLFSITLSRLVYGLRITIEENDAGVFVNRATVVRWDHEPSDPPDFDFRFVIGEWNDVGLAAANIAIDQPVGDSGEVEVTFPRPGRYVIKAVSGPRFVVIGTSNEVEVSPAPSLTLSVSTSASPTTRASPTPVDPTETSPPVIVGSASPQPGVIAGIVVGTLAVFLLITVAIFFLIRRRRRIAEKQMRLSFHPEQMVQQRRSRFLSIGRFTFRSSNSRADAEQGVGVAPRSAVTPRSAATPPASPPRSALPPPVNPFVTPAEYLTRPLPTPPGVTTPRSALRPLPVVPVSRLLSESPTLAHHLQVHRALPSVPRTQRQQQLEARVRQVKEQITELEQSRDGLERVVEDLKKQMEWLQANVDSDWALGLTDVPPPGFARYMTP